MTRHSEHSPQRNGTVLTRATLEDGAGEAPIDALPHQNINIIKETKDPAPASDLSVPARPFPWAALLVTALMGFLLIATETMPAGLLPQIASGLDVTEGTAGQFVSAYALGTVIAAMPAMALTRGLRRKPVFLVGILGFLAANLITAFSTDIVLSLGARGRAISAARGCRPLAGAAGSGPRTVSAVPKLKPSGFPSLMGLW